jgi:hypothetical protein
MAKAKKDLFTKPTIELFMNCLQQEFKAGENASSFIDETRRLIKKPEGEFLVVDTLNTGSSTEKDDDTPRWFAQWNEKHTQWHSKARRIENGLGHPISLLKVREESFGGIAYDPLFNKIYKVNKSGYILLSELINYYKKHDDLTRFASDHFNEEDIQSFFEFLKGAGHVFPA